MDHTSPTPSDTSGSQSPVSDRASTGIEGLDTILGGGLPRHYTYLLQGEPGTGKTTMGLQFAMAGAANNERVLYITTIESKEEIHLVAQSHGWSLDGITVYHQDSDTAVTRDVEQSVFHPAEVELPRAIANLLEAIDQVNPQRLVIDSLSEIRLLDVNRIWFRRQVIGLQSMLKDRACTTLLCDDRLTDKQPVESSVRGVINLEQLPPDYGPDRRRLRVAKLRGCEFAMGYHDYRIRTGRMEVYPRLVAAAHRHLLTETSLPTGLPELDSLLGGHGVDRGSSMLILGPAGAGKSLVASQIVAETAARGEPCAMYIFDERVQTLLRRARGLGLDLEGHVNAGTITTRQVDPAELTPGEFSHMVSDDVTKRSVGLVVIDSLTGYIHAMPNESLLTLHIHELISYLCQQGVTVMVMMAMHGLPGAPKTIPFDLSYISDSVLLLHHFEFQGQIRKAISVYKRRGGDHERSIRELQFTSHGIRIGEPLEQFRGIFTGIPDFTGKTLPHVEGDA